MSKYQQTKESLNAASSRLAMADVQMDDAFNAFKKTSKGNARQVDEDLLNDDLPWFASYSAFTSTFLIIFHRVEKYRPVTLDDVVSHKDITSTSTWRSFS